MRYQQLVSLERGEPSTAMRERVVAARARQKERFGRRKRVHSNAGMGAKDLQAWCGLERDAQDLLKMAISDLHFSARAYDRILKVARTIADLAGVEQIGPDHVSEAIQYRSLDRNLWR